MYKIERTNFKKVKRMPTLVLGLIIFSIVFGYFVRIYWAENEERNITFENIILDHQTHISTEVLFEVDNNTRQSGRKSIMVEIRTQNDFLMASKITTVELQPKRRTNHIVIMENFVRPVREGEILHARITIYRRPMI